MSKPNSPNTPNRYYFYKEGSKIVWYSDSMPKDPNTLIHIGTSDNPNPVMAAAYFISKVTSLTGYRVQELVETP